MTGSQPPVSQSDTPPAPPAPPAPPPVAVPVSPPPPGPASAAAAGAVAVGGPVVDAVYRMTKRDLFRVSMAVTRYSKISGLFGFLTSWTIVFGWATEDITSIVFVLFCLGFGVGLLPGLISAFFGGRRPEILAREIHLLADASGVLMESSGSMSRFNWATLKRVRPHGNDYVLDFGTGAATFIPEHALTAAQRADFERLVLAHGDLDLASQWRWLAIGAALGLAAILAFLFATGFFAGY